MDDAEVELSQNTHCIFDRFSLAVTSGTSTYSLPSNIVGILQITYKGKYIYPVDMADFQGDSWLKPQNLGVQGTPKYWIRSSIGWGQIMFYPIPDETISADDTNINTQTGLRDKVILSVYRYADPTDEDMRVAYYLRRNVCKYKAMARAYAKEGPQLNLQASEYFQKKFDYYSTAYKKFIEKIPSAVQLGFGEPSSGRGKTPPRPILPTSGKWSL
jgi:hypothetical protein